MVDGQMPVFRIDPLGVRYLEAVRNAGRTTGGVIGMNHWLHTLGRQAAAVFYEVAPTVSARQLADTVEQELRLERPGAPTPESVVLQGAKMIAALDGRGDILLPDLARTVLILGGYSVTGKASALNRADLATGMPQAQEQATTNGASGSTLAQIGQDLTAAAREGKLREAIGREAELQTVIEVLLRSTKRNPVLVGPPGVGKTALAEGLALRIARGDVPEIMRNTRVIALHPGSMLIGVENSNGLQERVKNVIEEASAGDVVLFIDEFHALVGMGGDEGRTDLATLLKPALARGDIACLAATTDSEYRRFIEQDGALERRFQPIRLNEPNREAVMSMLKGRAEEAERDRGIRVDDGTLGWLYDFADHFLRSRFFPDKAIDLLEQSVARALAVGSLEVTRDIAREVAERLVGMPVAVPERVEHLREELQRQGVLGIPHIETIAECLHVRMRGFDVDPAAPNVVILLIDGARSGASTICSTIARCLYGSEDRIVEIDFSRFTEPSTLTMLLGSPPSYVGYKEHVPLHDLLQTPWSVVKLLNIQCAHPSVRAVLNTALLDGYFTDGSGRRIHLSDCAVVLTAESGAAPDDSATPRDLAIRALGSELISVCDVVACDLPEGGEPFRRWFERDLMTSLTTRFERKGLTVKWRASVLEWLESLKESTGSPLELRREMDRTLAHALVRYLPEDSGVDAVAVGWRCRRRTRPRRTRRRSCRCRSQYCLPRGSSQEVRHCRRRRRRPRHSCRPWTTSAADAEVALDDAAAHRGARAVDAGADAAAGIHAALALGDVVRDAAGFDARAVDRHDAAAEAALPVIEPVDAALGRCCARCRSWSRRRCRRSRCRRRCFRRR